MITIGIFLASCVNSLILVYMSGDVQWRLAVGLQFVPCAILIGMVFILPFSPRWLLLKKRNDEALTVLARMREVPKDSADIKSEFSILSNQIEEEEAIGSASWSELLEKGTRNRVGIACTLQFFQQWTGINIILYFGSFLFEQMGFPSAQSSVVFVIVNSFINFVATFPGMWLIEKIGRRSLLLYGGVLMAISHFLITLFVGLSFHVDTGLAWGGVVFIFVFIITFSSTWGPVVWVYQSEIFTPRTSARGTSLGSVSNWTWNAVISKIIPLILVKIDFYTYLIFGGFGLAMALFTYIFVPETKGKDAEGINALFGEEQPNSKLGESSSAML